MDSFATSNRTHVFGSALTIDSDFLGNSSDFTAVDRGQFEKLFLHIEFPTAPAAADTDIVTLELASASSNNDSDFANVDTANFSVAFSPGASSAAAYGSLEADIDLRLAGAGKWLRPSLAVAGSGLSVGNVWAIGVLYHGNGVQDHDMADTDGPVTN